MNLGEFKVTFDGILQNYVAEKSNQAKQLLKNEKINQYIDYIATFIFSGGKRIRPYGLWIVYTGFGGKNEKAILNFGIIFELLHTMALIHDDIIDKAKKRHNILTMHEYITGLLSNNNHQLGEGQAILIGDLVLSRVYELRYKNHDFTDELVFKARENVHSMVEEVILGQMLDVEMMVGEEATAEMIEQKNMFKTASYTFIRPMLIGAILAGADEANQNLIKEFGKNLGIAFQVRDDMFDIIGADKTKSIFSDIQEGQQTIFTHYIFEKGQEAEKKLLKSCSGKPLQEDQILQLQKMFHDSGAIKYGKEMIKKYAQQAEQILDQIVFTNNKSKEGLQVLINKISDV